MNGRRDILPRGLMMVRDCKRCCAELAKSSGQAAQSMAGFDWQSVPVDVVAGAVVRRLAAWADLAVEAFGKNIFESVSDCGDAVFDL